LYDSGDNVVLHEPSGAAMDSLKYSPDWGGGSGLSREKRMPERASANQQNWSSSIAGFGGTPGARNSISPQDFDLAILVNDIQFEQVISGEFDIIAKVRNVGLMSVSSFDVVFYEDLNGNLFPEQSELIGPRVEISQPLASGDSTTIAFPFDDASSGNHRIIVVVEFQADQNLTNNEANAVLVIPFTRGTLSINEIMYSPLDGEAEWVEIINLSNSSVDLQNWAVSDSGLEDAGFVENEIVIAPNDFVVFAQNPNVALAPSEKMVAISGWPSLNNSGDQVVLFDQAGTTVDSLRFLDSWGGDKGISLEKINPTLSSTDSTNWSSSAASNGSTPGTVNSVFAESLVSNAILAIGPNPFSPDSDGDDDFTLLSYSLPVATARVNVKIYDLHGRLIRFLANNRASGSENTLVWDGRDDDGRVARIGIYVVFLQAINANSGVLSTQKKTVVLAARL